VSLLIDVVARRGHFELAAAGTFAPGDKVAVVGPNGAGKSTLLAVIAGLLRPTAGRVLLDGSVLDDAERGVHVPPQARRIGVVFQDRLLFPHLTALENVAFPLRARGVARREARARAGAWLERLGVAHHAEARPPTLSGGEAQRVALARALVFEPRVLVLDEPFTALDVRSRGQIRALVRAVLADFAGVSLVVTHDPVDALALATRLVIIEAGRVTQTGAPDDIRRAPRTPYAAALVGQNLFTGRLEPLEPGVGRLVTGDGEIVVAVADGPPGSVDGVIGVLRPADVSLHLTRPEGSARNVVAGHVEAIDFDGERARVRVAGAPPVVAEITRGSVARLGLVEGAPVWASFKAVEVDVRWP